MSHLNYNSHEALLTQHISGFDPLLPKNHTFLWENFDDTFHTLPSPCQIFTRGVGGKCPSLVRAAPRLL